MFVSRLLLNPWTYSQLLEKSITPLKLALATGTSTRFPFSDFLLVEEFITKQEHDALLEEADSKLRRYKYESVHFDSVIKGYREATISKWGKKESQEVAQRVMRLFPNLEFLPVHLLDLQADGHIKPHLDHLKYSGGIIIGVSLLSDAIMRLESEKEKDLKAEIVIKARSLYIQSGRCRYEFQHSILGPNDKPLFLPSDAVNRNRRISLMFRDVYIEK